MLNTKKRSKFSEEDVLRYAILCNLIETLWARSGDKDFYDIDFEDLLPLTSPQARRIATFINDLYTVPGVNFKKFVGKIEGNGKR